MVNNAGVSFEAVSPAVLHETDDKIWDDTMRINARSVFLGCKYAIRQMLKQEPHESGDRGWIINMSSIMGLIAGPQNRKAASVPNLRSYPRADSGLDGNSFILRFERRGDELDEASGPGLRRAPHTLQRDMPWL